MLANGLETYESWDLKQLSVPSRSRLYQLQPVGIGTRNSQKQGLDVADGKSLARTECNFENLFYSSSICAGFFDSRDC